MATQKIKQSDIKPEFYATKLYLAKLSEKYKHRGYEKVFLENDYNYLNENKELIKNLNIQNDLLDELIYKMTKSIQHLSKMINLDPKIKKVLVEDNIMLFAKFMEFIEANIKNEDFTMGSIDRFRKIEKKIDIKTKALSKYWFDVELDEVFESINLKKYKEVSVYIFDMNNLKTLNETYWHQTWSESIFKFWIILKEVLSELWYKYILSNYYWWDEWFLAIVDVSMKDSITLLKRLFQKLTAWTYRIRDFEIDLSACWGLAHFHPTKATKMENYNAKMLLHIADTLVLQAKIQKNRNKSWNAYKALNITHVKEDELKNFLTSVHTLPKKLQKSTLDKKKLVELFDIRKKQNEKIMRARTLWVKKILKNNIELINEVIWFKILESIAKMMSENKIRTRDALPEITRKLTHIVTGEVEKMANISYFSVDWKDEMADKILMSAEYQKFTKKIIDELFNENIFKAEIANTVYIDKRILWEKN
ncbi:MAG: hypothetical protein ACD_3C00006G0005 [uncultured bacterium (gcode 4)]|uniref:GGDEF domain-containing protein n=1 Tax=uncultured bacterium (gcode 4) TaxID=1234023 RepID=K2G0Q0_9BACT|nr:MAG: hypothetical protein ACD_3C00006G0005 [uncultured bacterium (gcode 4)]